MKQALIVIPAILFITGVNFALEPVAKYITAGMAGLLPERQVLTGYNIQPYYDRDIPFNAVFTVTGSAVLVEFRSIASIYSAVMDRSFRFRSSELVYIDRGRIKGAGFNKRSARYDSDKKAVVLDFRLDGKKVGTKEVPFGPGSIDSESGFLLMQALLLSGAEGFNADYVLGTMGASLNADFNLVETDEPLRLDTRKDFPAALKEMVKKAGRVKVYVMNLTGAAGLVYPHRYFFVFAGAPPFRFLGYWGGPPERTEAMVCLQ